ncbi:hypothetical protein PseudUWO311_20225 [Pseudanabaena sp. UWO311]|uniref:hypothetical protein n=1 Tax=Pseudanabaena sp. UWO311 TaxID=2487337 RepID=UPI00115955B9|nr:hypothetical protein [Pseudanabaena sp. UWO311]TYQ24111.1 hypothetical protein PseudUWO311_20225 [Pseudanabaena sp. UWO311]
MNTIIKYLPTAAAAEALGLSSGKALIGYLSELKQGVHYQDRRKAGARKAKYFFNVEAIRNYWDKPPERR